MQINTNIKLIRELSGKKQEEFAKLLNTKLSNLKTYENTDVNPKANVKAALAELAGISILDLETKKLTYKDIKFRKGLVDKVEKDGSRGTDVIEFDEDVAIIKEIKGTDVNYRDKYIETLERIRDQYEKDFLDYRKLVAANLTELLKAQRYDRAQLTTLLHVTASTLAKVSGRNSEEVLQETNKAVNDQIAAQQ